MNISKKKSYLLSFVLVIVLATTSTISVKAETAPTTTVQEKIATQIMVEAKTNYSRLTDAHDAVYELPTAWKKTRYNLIQAYNKIALKINQEAAAQIRAAKANPTADTIEKACKTTEYLPSGNAKTTYLNILSTLGYKIKSIYPVETTIVAGNPQDIPTIISVDMTNYDYPDRDVVWNLSNIDINKPGTYSATGKVAGYSGQVLLTLTIKPSALGNSIKNPAKLGQTLTVSDSNYSNGNYVYDIKLTDVVRGTSAATMVSKANMFNGVTSANEEYILCKYWIKVKSTEDGNALDINNGMFDYFNSQGKRYRYFVSVAGLEPEFNAELNAGQECTGWAYMAVTKNDPTKAVINLGRDNEYWFNLSK